MGEVAGCSSYPSPLALEPFQYATDRRASDDSSTSAKLRKVTLTPAAGRPESGRERQRTLNSWRRSPRGGYDDKPSRGGCVAPNGRRWQAKNGQTRVVYVES